jgi:hypothetical protein
MYPNEESYLSNYSVIIQKHIKAYVLNTCVIAENAKLKERAQENKTPQASTSTDTTPTPIIYDYNQAN